MPDSDANMPVPSTIDSRIYTVRGQTVMLDSDLAEVYGVETGALNRAARRNADRFPERFAFQLQQNEWDALRCQIGILKPGRGQHRKYMPLVFTEHGAVMLASVLKSSLAVQASIAVVDAFVRLRRTLDTNRELARKVDELAAQVGDHRKAIAVIFQELEELTQNVEPEQPKERIGFKPNKAQRVTGKAFRGLAGSLKKSATFKQDAVKLQREMRDEW